jgi:hypothetical protein
MRKYLILTALVPVLLATGCVRTYRAAGDTHLTVFDHAHVQFLPDSLGNFTEADAEGIVHLTNGRIILKKIQLPDYKRKVDIHLTVRVESDGDRWDKSGSVFVIPADGPKVNLLSIAKGEATYPEVDSTRYEKLIGTVPGPDFAPLVELMRFMTPFGVGYYSRRDTSTYRTRRPVYIDEWAPEAVWEADITDLYPLLKGEAWVGVFIDTWTAEGYLASVDIDVTETECPYEPVPKGHVTPLVNTVYYMGQAYPDIFARKDLTVDFELPEFASKASLRYIVTGHGGHSEGDEFTRQRNLVSVDGSPVLDFTPWRTDCSSFRRFNPTSGIWPIRRGQPVVTRRQGPGRPQRPDGLDVVENLASSDLSRSGWCPGSQAEPYDAPLGELAAGMHRLTISIPGAQAIDGDKMNHWLVSAYLVWEE